MAAFTINVQVSGYVLVYTEWFPFTELEQQPELTASGVQSPGKDLKVCKESPPPGLDLFPFTVKGSEKDKFLENCLGALYNLVENYYKWRIT